MKGDPMPKICFGGCGRQFVCRGECNQYDRTSDKSSCWCTECIKTKYVYSRKGSQRCQSRFPNDYVSSWRSKP